MYCQMEYQTISLFLCCACKVSKCLLFPLHGIASSLTYVLCHRTYLALSILLKGVKTFLFGSGAPLNSYLERELYKFQG